MTSQIPTSKISTNLLVNTSSVQRRRKRDCSARGDADHRQPPDSNWSELIASMDKMHMAMGAVARSGNTDVDFVRLMLPHHQAAVDMAKTQLGTGKDPQNAQAGSGNHHRPTIRNRVDAALAETTTWKLI